MIINISIHTLSPPFIEIVPHDDIVGQVGEQLDVFCNYNSTLFAPEDVEFKTVANGAFVTVESEVLSS